MKINVARHGGVTVVSVGRELSLRSGATLKESVVERVQQGERQFVFDFAETEFIDSAGLGALIAMSKLVHSHDGTVRLMQLNDDMRRLFELTKLDTLFDVVAPSAADEELVLPERSATGPGVERPGQMH